MTVDQPPQPARYADWYHSMSYRDFLANEAAGTLNAGTISTRTDQDEL